jgi:hypothetical protein
MTKTGWREVLLAAGLLVTCLSCQPQPPRGERGEDQSFFPITPWELPSEKRRMWSDPKQGVSTLRDCGFTVAAFVTPDQVPLCEKNGMRALIGPPGDMVKWEELTDAQIFQTVKKMVDESGESPAVMGFFLTDEPGVKAFPALGKAVAAVKKLAPGKLAYINLYPNYATLGAPDLSQLGTASYTEYLERYVNEVKPQFISYDNYQVQYSRDLADRGTAESYFTNLLEIRRVAMEHSLPFWNIVSSNQIRPETPVPSPANLLMQAYTTLAAGGRGLTWYTYYVGGYHYAAIDKAGNRTATWAYLKMVNDQVKVLGPMMNRLTSTGVYFTSPPPAASLPVLPGKVVQSIDSSPTAAAMVGEFDGAGGEKFVMLVNLSLERSSRLTVKTVTPYPTAQVVSPVDGSLSPLGAEQSIWLPAGQGVLIRLR